MISKLRSGRTGMMTFDRAGYVLAIGMILVIFTAALVSVMLEDTPSQVPLYCEMVEEFKQSGGEYGWPAYKGESQCEL